MLSCSQKQRRRARRKAASSLRAGIRRVCGYDGWAASGCGAHEGFINRTSSDTNTRSGPAVGQPAFSLSLPAASERSSGPQGRFHRLPSFQDILVS